MRTVSVVIPIFNEAALIPLLVATLERELVQAGAPYRFEFVLVDDGSRDGSFELLLRHTEGLPHYRLVRLSRNFGHQIAITAGMAEAHGEAVVVMDADLQDPPRVILDFLAKWEEGFHVVYGVRRNRAGETAFKRATAGLFYRTLRALTNVDMPVDVGDFRLVDRRVCDEYIRMHEKDPYVRGLISWLGFNQIGVPYDRAARAVGTTKFPLRKMLHFAFDAITSFSTVPLRLCTVTGLILSGVSFASILYFLWLKLVLRAIVPGMAATVIILLFFSGVQLIATGIIGEYIARIFNESKHRPLYVIMDRVDRTARKADA